MKTETTTKRGGKREGSGRPKKPETKLKTFRIPVKNFDEIVKRIYELIESYKA